MEPITVVNIISVSYSGSTWLNLMLGSHPEAFSVGELKKVRQLGRAVCLLHGEDCPVWSRYDAQEQRNPFQQIADIAGKRLLVVNNSRKYLGVQTAPQVRPRFIHLVRDGRAVTASMLRKFPDRGTWRAARWWRHEIARNLRLLRRQPAGDVLTLQYEQIASGPEAPLREACRFLGLDFDPAMLAYWEGEHHFLGGNRGTLVSLIGDRGGDDAALRDPRTQTSAARWDLEHYRKADPSRFVDERWKRELSPRQRRVFRLAAGAMNRRLGYGAG